ncbi:MAG: hypothetical protein K0Q72_4824 [Armatimonadetes bacterium]|nr:hypothetical protein [Armatimonadota bacterium]
MIGRKKGQPGLARVRWAVSLLAAVGLLAAAGLKAQTMLQKALFDDEVAAHWIYDDFGKAVAQAQATGKPILAVLRCVP